MKRRKRKEGLDGEDETQALRNGYQGGQRAVWGRWREGMNVLAEEYTLILGICQSLKSQPQEETHPRLGSPTDSG